MSTWYISGPMTGYENYNHEMFDRADKTLRGSDHFVDAIFNPAQMDRDLVRESGIKSGDIPRRTYMKQDINALVKCDKILFLPEFRQSKGAMVEALVAMELELEPYVLNRVHGNPQGHVLYRIDRTTYGIAGISSALNIAGSEIDEKVETVEDLKDPEESSKENNILSEAMGLTYGDRHEDYGHPYHDFKCVVEMFNSWAQHKYDWFKGLEPVDHCAYMQCVKMSREAHRPKRDNRVDGAGYWDTWQRTEEYEQRG